MASGVKPFISVVVGPVTRTELDTLRAAYLRESAGAELEFRIGRLALTGAAGAFVHLTGAGITALELVLTGGLGRLT